MDYTFDILEPNADIDKALSELQENMAELYAEGWTKVNSPLYNKPFDLNITTFAQMWFSKGLKIFLAFEPGNKKPVGYVLAITYRPMAFNSQILQIEDWYLRGDDAAGVDAMFQYVSDASRFLGVDELWIGRAQLERKPSIPGRWKEAGTFHNTRYVRS